MVQHTLSGVVVRPQIPEMDIDWVIFTGLRLSLEKQLFSSIKLHPVECKSSWTLRQWSSTQVLWVCIFPKICVMEPTR